MQALDLPARLPLASAQVKSLGHCAGAFQIRHVPRDPASAVASTAQVAQRTPQTHAADLALAETEAIFTVCDLQVCQLRLEVMPMLQLNC